MKYIARYYDGDTLLRARQLLREKGIATHVVQEESRRLGEQWALFVCFNAQAEDALRVLHDPRHQPATRIDVAAFEQRTATADLRLLTRYASIAFLIAVPLLCALIYLLWRYA
ncbi:hypothetical protein M3S04_19885 [Xanthomonas sp. PPL139]|uniref:hypothetical protein n=1 Tax=unclassified Xanthomonas TaxID=2643310 RepID=UPI0033A2AAA0